jgi:hypothetical protein
VILGVPEEIKERHTAWRSARHEAGEVITVNLISLFAVKVHDKTLSHVGQSFVNHHAMSSFGLACIVSSTLFRQITVSQ